MGGLIPAHAGKTLRVSQLALGVPAHPRSRGENFAEAGISTSIRGSSPLTRGKHSESLMLYRARGLIPAHAGKTPTASAARSTPRAHPRSRGENLGCLWLCLRVWWLIPAHAGKTDGGDRADARHEAHPRSRGENIAAEPSKPSAKGSSPLARGKL